MERHRELTELTKSWKAPADLSLSCPREVKLAGGGIAIACMVVLFFLGAIAAGLGLSSISARQAGEKQVLSQSGVEAQGTVTRHWRTREKDPQDKITYEFRHEGRIYHGSTKTPRRIWQRLEVGSTLAIRFVPSNPEVNHPSEWEMDVMPAFVPGLLALVLAGIAMMLLWMLRRQMQLLADGRPGPAIVIGHKRVKGGKVLRYEFPLMDGNVGKGRGGQTRKPPEVGSVITVVYDRDNPKRNAPYPFDLVRVVR